MSDLVTIAGATAAGRAFIKAASATVADIDRVLETLTKMHDRTRQRRERRRLDYLRRKLTRVYHFKDDVLDALNHYRDQAATPEGWQRLRKLFGWLSKLLRSAWLTLRRTAFSDTASAAESATAAKAASDAFAGLAASEAPDPRVRQDYERLVELGVQIRALRKKAVDGLKLADSKLGALGKAA